LLTVYRKLIFLALLVVSISNADDATSTQFLRITTDSMNRPQALQVAIAAYGSSSKFSGVRVELIGAVHIGDATYYAKLNERFTTYDALLYELIAPEGTAITPDVQSDSAVSSAQRFMRSMLDLAFQLEEIDYSQPNFVHADLTPDEFVASMTQRGESLYTYFWKIISASMREASQDPFGINSMDKIVTAFSSGKAHPLKVMLAYEFADLDRFSDMLGDDSTSAIIGARNERAIEVLLRELDAGKRHVGIFYGAAHMRDLEKRLLQLGFTAVETDWIDAWAF
jgi:hypothetical protein